MSPRQFGKVDVSASWLPCPACPHRHVLTAPCPPAGAWLVLTFCRSCDAKTGVQCRLHRDRRAPAVVPEQAVVASRYEHEEVEG